MASKQRKVPLRVDSMDMLVPKLSITVVDDDDGDDAAVRAARLAGMPQSRSKKPSKPIVSSPLPAPNPFPSSVGTILKRLPMIDPTTGALSDMCALCNEGGTLLVCDGPCGRAFHLPCVALASLPTSDSWICPDCTRKKHMCLICGGVGIDADAGTLDAWFAGSMDLVQKCGTARCGRFYHKK